MMQVATTLGQGRLAAALVMVTMQAAPVARNEATLRRNTGWTQAPCPLHAKRAMNSRRNACNLYLKTQAYKASLIHQVWQSLDSRCVLAAPWCPFACCPKT
jgi:hypothetical protein